jgi:hypothetical protein
MGVIFQYGNIFDRMYVILSNYYSGINQERMAGRSEKKGKAGS